jgi:pyruvate carboxylase
MVEGSLGQPPGGWPKAIQRVVLRGGKPKRGRPGANLKAVNLRQTAKSLEEQLGSAPSRTDLMSYLMYPQVFTEFAQVRRDYDDTSVLPTPEFFYGMRQGEEFTVELEPGKTLIIKYLTTSDPHEDGSRTVFFELNGEPRSVSVRDKSLEAKATSHVKADANHKGHVGAPIPGAVTSIAVEVGRAVTKGDRLLVMEAMKMQSTVYAPSAGKVAEILIAVGEQVEPKDLLLVIE